MHVLFPGSSGSDIVSDGEVCELSWVMLCWYRTSAAANNSPEASRDLDSSCDLDSMKRQAVIPAVILEHCNGELVLKMRSAYKHVQYQELQS